MAKILFIDDKEEMRALFITLGYHPDLVIHQCAVASNASFALLLLKGAENDNGKALQLENPEDCDDEQEEKGPFSVVVVDYRMKNGPNGLELIAQSRQELSSPPQFILVSGHDFKDDPKYTNLLTPQNQPDVILTKPFLIPELIKTIRGFIT